MEAFEKDNVTICIPCDGSPQPVVKWTKDGGNIDTKDGHFTIKQDGSSYHVIIKEVTPEDAGCYQAEFTNRAGEKKTSLQLNVHCKSSQSRVRKKENLFKMNFLAILFPWSKIIFERMHQAFIMQELRFPEYPHIFFFSRSFGWIGYT